MNKKVFLFGVGIFLLLILSSFVSARISYERYNAREDIKIYTSCRRAESIDIIYKKPAERISFYQIGTYAETYGKFDVAPTKKNCETSLIFPNQTSFQREPSKKNFKAEPYVKKCLVN